MEIEILVSKEKILARSFALGGVYYIVVGSLFSFFNREEAAWILAHELGHVQDSLHSCPCLDKTVPEKICLCILLLALLSGYFSFLLPILLCLVLVCIVYRWQRREYEADRFACRVMGQRVGVSVLQKLQTLDRGCGSSLTHPSYSSRLRKITFQN